MLLTLLVTVVLTIVVLEFNYLMRVHATLSGNLVEDLRAEAAARGGIETAKARLLNDLLADLKSNSPSDTLEDDWAEDIAVETASFVGETVISDETSKLNLNRLVQRPRTEFDTESPNLPMIESVRRLFELLELDPNLVDCIVDWLDENDQEQPFGAEGSYYESLSPPIACKNGPMDSVEELLLVSGFDEAILFGDEDKPGLAEYVTVFGGDRGLVNINTADEKVIAALLNSESLASTIVDVRKSSPFVSPEDIATRVSDAALSDKLTMRSSHFLVTSAGRVRLDDAPTRQVKIKALLRADTC